jgi:hypothetical protein
MPIEIRELVVRARIEPGEGSAAGSPGSSSNTSGSGPSPEDLRAAVSEALRALADRHER